MSKDGLYAIVTGSASGLGAATANILAQGGGRIVINYSNSKADAEATAEACRKAGLTFVEFPIEDFGVPASAARIAPVVQRIVTTLRHGGSVGVHCNQSIGRSGLLASCVLVALEFDRRTAIVAAVLAGFLSFNTIYASTQSSDAVCTVIFLAGLLAFANGRARGQIGWFVLAGALLGLAPQFRPNLVMLPLALGGAYLIAAVGGGMEFVILAAASSRLIGWRIRLGAMVAAGAVALVAVALTFPSCFNDPHSIVDPLVRDVWLANVKQARPLSVILRLRPLAALPIVMPLLRKASARSPGSSISGFAMSSRSRGSRSFPSLNDRGVTVPSNSTAATR